MTATVMCEINKYMYCSLQNWSENREFLVGAVLAPGLVNQWHMKIYLD